MVVVAIIGVLSLLGLRLYSGQQEKAKNAIVKANAGTVQTLIQAELADQAYTTTDSILKAIDSDWTGADDHRAMAGMHNPYGGTDVVNDNHPEIGEVTVTYASAVFTIQGYGKTASDKVGEELTARR